MNKKPYYNYYLNLLQENESPKFLEKYLKTPCLLRLQKVGYLCGMQYASKDIYNFQEDISRYDHSLSVALLTWKCTKDLKATLAGLFHDISTPCFSHVIDYMNKDYKNQESTEEYTENILKQDTYLQKCLKEDNIFLEDIMDFKKYSIVDNNRPKLCADRLDGIILTGIAWTKTMQKEAIKAIMEDIEVYKNGEGEQEIGFKSKLVANLVLDTNENIDIYCHSQEDNYMMELLANITRNAILSNTISYDDLYTLNEENLMQILKNSQKEIISKELKIFETIKKEEIPQINMPVIKKRNINPLVGGRRLID